MDNNSLNASSPVKKKAEIYMQQWDFHRHERRDAFISGYHSRDEEVKDLLQGIKMCMGNVSIIDRMPPHILNTLRNLLTKYNQK